MDAATARSGEMRSNGEAGGGKHMPLRLWGNVIQWGILFAPDTLIGVQ